MGFWRMFKQTIIHATATESLCDLLTLAWVGLFESWNPEIWRHGEPTRRQNRLFISVSEKKTYGSHWACLYVSEIEKMRDGNGVVLECGAMYIKRQWRQEETDDILGHSCKFQRKQCEILFHEEKTWTSRPHTVLHKHENKISTLFKMYSIWIFPKQYICYSYNCFAIFSECIKLQGK